MNLVHGKQNYLSRRSPGDLFSIQRELRDLFDLSLSKWWKEPHEGFMENAWSPSLDIYESKDNLLVKADLPGLKKEDIKVSVQAGTLIIEGEKKSEKENKDKGTLRTERTYGSFYRAIALPAAVDESKVKAVYKQGVLELTLPKTEEAKPKQIAIE